MKYLITVLLCSVIIFSSIICIDAGEWLNPVVANRSDHPTADLRRSEDHPTSPMEAGTEDLFTPDPAYPAASYIWHYLRKAGYSDRVTAAILGNIMNECGGNTLALKPYTKVGNFYGICMWSGKYSSIDGASLEAQCEYLCDTMEREFEVFGDNYRAGFSYQDFIVMTDIAQATLAFAVVYERCGTGSYTTRQENASIAYSYFAAP